MKKQYFNLGFIQVIVWGIIVFMIRNSRACNESKVLWLLICLIGINYSINKWIQYSKLKQGGEDENK